jgi:hypothetical protein
MNETDVKNNYRLQQNKSNNYWVNTTPKQYAMAAATSYSNLTIMLKL